MDQSLIWYKMKAMFKICNIHLKNVSVVTSVYWPYSRFVSDTNKHLNPTILAKWPRAYMQNFTARNIIFESLALLNFIFRNTHTQDAPACASAFQQKCSCRYFAQLWMICRQAEHFSCVFVFYRICTRVYYFAVQQCAQRVRVWQQSAE
jgi:hypothetical protein